MFIHGFTKCAATLVTMSPEEYFGIVREKDPAIGSLAGAATGAAVGAARGAKGKKSKSALIGAGVGAAAGGVAGHQVSKGVRRYQARKVRRMAEELHLKSAPGRAKARQG